MWRKFYGIIPNAVSNLNFDKQKTAEEDEFGDYYMETVRESNCELIARHDRLAEQIKRKTPKS
jgi:hypothetical protein